MDEAQFWTTIESIWEECEGESRSRKALLKNSLSAEQMEELSENMEEFVSLLQEHLETLPAEELLSFDQILERKLYELDRAEIQEHTDGSDDGFLYCRGFIVAAGRRYFDTVSANPSKAIMDLECEEMCYISKHIYEEKFGKMPASEISRETGSNKKGWPQ